MAFKLETVKALTEAFPSVLIKQNPQGLDYVPVAEVVARMNRIVGVGNWRPETLETKTWGERPTIYGVCPVHVIANIRVHVKDDDGEWTYSDGWGGQDVGFFNSKAEKWAKDKKYKKVSGNEPVWTPEDQLSPGPLNLGDAYKGAASDGMKKALQHLGVALELARKNDALEYEQHQQREQEREQQRREAEAQMNEVQQEAKKMLDAFLAKKDAKKLEHFKAWKEEQRFPGYSELHTMTDKQANDVMDYLGFLEEQTA